MTKYVLVTSSCRSRTSKCSLSLFRHQWPKLSGVSAALKILKREPPWEGPLRSHLGRPSLAAAPNDLSETKASLSQEESLTHQQFRFQSLETPHVIVQGWGQAWAPTSNTLDQEQPPTAQLPNLSFYSLCAFLPTPGSKKPRSLDIKNLYKAIRLERWAEKGRAGKNNQHFKYTDLWSSNSTSRDLNTLTHVHKDRYNKMFIAPLFVTVKKKKERT